MGDECSPLPQKLDLAIIGPHGMGHYRSAVQKPELVVCVCIASRPRAELLHPLYLGGILIEVRLDRKPSLLCDAAKGAKQLIAAGWNEARSDDRLDAALGRALEEPEGLRNGGNCLL